MGVVTRIDTAGRREDGIRAATELASAIAGRRAKVLGCDIDRVDLAQTLEFCEDVIQSRGFA